MPTVRTVGVCFGARPSDQAQEGQCRVKTLGIFWFSLNALPSGGHGADAKAR